MFCMHPHILHILCVNVRVLRIHEVMFVYDDRMFVYDDRMFINSTSSLIYLGICCPLIRDYMRSYQDVLLNNWNQEYLLYD